MIDFIGYWSRKTGLAALLFVAWIGISESKYFDWKKRHGQPNRHNGRIPRVWWLEDWEKQTIIDFYRQYPQEGYRRLCYMMMDRDIVAVSPATVYRVLKESGLMRKWSRSPSSKGTGFDQPKTPHEHWHIDISYLNICGTFYYLCSILDGCSRAILHWEIRESMKESEVEICLERTREAFPGVSPRLISDNGPQFIAGEFKDYVRLCGMTHVRTSPYYPQSNGKIERYHRTIKSESIRQKTPLSLDDARRIVSQFVEHYNTVRLHSAIGYLTPKDKLQGREQEIWNNRDLKLSAAQEARRQHRGQMKQAVDD